MFVPQGFDLKCVLNFVMFLFPSRAQRHSSPVCDLTATGQSIFNFYYLVADCFPLWIDAMFIILQPHLFLLS